MTDLNVGKTGSRISSDGTRVIGGLYQTIWEKMDLFAVELLKEKDPSVSWKM